MTASQKAGELASKLFALCNEFRNLQQSIQANRSRSEQKADAVSQVDSVASSLAGVYQSISGPDAEFDLFTDLLHDAPEYAFNLPDELEEDFAAILASLINATGLTVNAFCEKHNLSQSSVQSYVSGKSRPTWDKVQELAKALGASTDVFRDK